MKNRESGPGLADPEQNSVVRGAAFKRSAVQKTIIPLNQRSRGIVSVHVIAVCVGPKGEKESELTTGCDFEERTPVRIRATEGGELGRAVEIAVRSLNEHIRRVPVCANTAVGVRAGETKHLRDLPTRYGCKKHSEAQRE